MLVKIITVVKGSKSKHGFARSSFPLQTNGLTILLLANVAFRYKHPLLDF